MFSKEWVADRKEFFQVSLFLSNSLWHDIFLSRGHRHFIITNLHLSDCVFQFFMVEVSGITK